MLIFLPAYDPLPFALGFAIAVGFAIAIPFAIAIAIEFDPQTGCRWRYP